MPPELVLRRERRREIRQVVERRIVSQTVVHNHITQKAFWRVYPRRDTVLRILSPTKSERDEERSRPTLAARRLVRLFSAESARNELGQFFRGVVKTVLREEREVVRSHPRREVSLIYHLLREEVRTGRAEPSEPPPPPLRAPQEERKTLKLDGAEFRRVVRGVERALERRGRLERLRGEGI